jgi:hypothetical protein
MKEYTIEHGITRTMHEKDCVVKLDDGREVYVTIYYTETDYTEKEYEDHEIKEISGEVSEKELERIEKMVNDLIDSGELY